MNPLPPKQGGQNELREGVKMNPYNKYLDKYSIEEGCLPTNTSDQEQEVLEETPNDPPSQLPEEKEINLDALEFELQDDDSQNQYSYKKFGLDAYFSKRNLLARIEQGWTLPLKTLFCRWLRLRHELPNKPKMSQTSAVELARQVAYSLSKRGKDWELQDVYKCLGAASSGHWMSFSQEYLIDEAKRRTNKIDHQELRKNEQARKHNAGVAVATTGSTTGHFDDVSFEELTVR